MRNDEEIREVIKHYRDLTQDVSNEVAMDTLDTPGFIHLVGLAAEGSHKSVANAILLSCRLGYRAGFLAANQAHCCHR